MNYEISIDLVPYSLEINGGEARILGAENLFAGLKGRNSDRFPEKYQGVLINPSFFRCEFYYVDHIGSELKITSQRDDIYIEEVEDVCRYLLYYMDVIGYECLSPVPD